MKDHEPFKFHSNVRVLRQGEYPRVVMKYRPTSVIEVATIYGVRTCVETSWAHHFMTREFGPACHVYVESDNEEELREQVLAKEHKFVNQFGNDTDDVLILYYWDACFEHSGLWHYDCQVYGIRQLPTQHFTVTI